MLEANLKIISALKTFLFTVAHTEEYLSIFRNSNSDFTRRRKLSFEKLTLLIVRLCKKTLSVEIESFFTELNTNLSCSVAAFSLQRVKLNPLFFDSWNKVLWMNFYSEYGNKVKRWKGFRVLGCDGSNISLVNKPELNSYFGGQSNQVSSFVIAKTFYCYDVLNKLVLFSKIGPYRYSELSMACDMVEQGIIEKDMLMIYDRYYSNYKMLALIQFQENSTKYVIRVKDSLSFSQQFIKSKKKSSVISLTPSLNSIKGLKMYGYNVSKNTAIKTRLVRVKLASGQIEVLMTNLWEEEGYKSNEFASLYALRWGVESNIYFQKNILQLECASGLTKVSVIQDFYATVFMTNLHFLLIKQAQNTVDEKMSNKKYPMQINNNKAYGKIKENLINLFITSKPEKILIKLHDYFIRAPLPIRKNRCYPRITKNPKNHSKYKTFTNFKPAY